MTDQAITDAELDRLEREWGSVAGIRKVFRDLRRLREENGNLLALTHEWDVSCVKLQARVRELEAALEDRHYKGCPMVQPAWQIQSAKRYAYPAKYEPVCTCAALGERKA